MSNVTAISAVTRALCALFNKIHTIPGMPSELTDLRVTAVPPDQAGTDVSATSLNVFLYQVATNAAWRNMNVPRQLPAGSTASPPPDVPPAALDLNYLITAYGKDNDDTLAHLALAAAVSLLADNACLSPQLMQEAVTTSGVAVGEIDLYLQRERVRVTPKPLTIEEISKLWTIFQAKYRISVSYQASVVLIDSLQPPRAPLPVLKYQVDTASRLPFPTLSAITLPRGQPGVRLGDTVVLTGHALGGGTAEVLFQSAVVPDPLTGTVTTQSDDAVTVTVPRAATTWPAGPYLVSVRCTDPPPPDGSGRARTTNALPLALAPTISSVTPPDPGATSPAVAVQCSPPVWPQQRASLLLDDIEIPLPGGVVPAGPPAGQLSFPVSGLAPGTYFVRLRVDGVDSLLDYTKTPTMQVTLP